jgi:uncharacterized protein (DUF924 family)
VAVSTPDAVLDFWFPADPARQSALWWGKNPKLDAEIRERFGATLAAAKRGELDDWAEQPSGRLALVIVLDQFSRNIHRGDAKTHEADEQALALALAGIDRGHDQALPRAWRLFMYLPLEHAESLEHQERCIELCSALADEVAADPASDAATRERYASYVAYAVRHRDVIAKFGRFPHRNALLGRESTPAELEYLAQPGAGF